jgi:hypothetical protein
MTRLNNSCLLFSTASKIKQHAGKTNSTFNARKQALEGNAGLATLS